MEQNGRENCSPQSTYETIRKVKQKSTTIGESRYFRDAVRIEAWSIKYHCLQTAYLNCFSAAWIIAAQLVIQPDPIVSRFFKFSPIPFISPPWKLGFFCPTSPSDRVFLSGPAFRAVDLGRDNFIFFIKQVTFFHNETLCCIHHDSIKNLPGVRLIWY